MSVPKVTWPPALRSLGQSGSTHRWVVAPTSAAIGSLLVLTGCSAVVGEQKQAAQATMARISISPVTEGKKVPADSPVVVRVEDGSLTSVTVTGPKGSVNGALSPDGSTWTSTRDSLEFGTKYKVAATAVDPVGLAAEVDRTFTTVKPKKTVSGQFVYFTPGQKVGVGLPARLEFDQPIKNTTEVEQRLNVTSTEALAGAWSWDTDHTAVTFRPQGYWPANAKISVRATIAGLKVAPGVYAIKNVSTNFHTGDRMISTVNAKTLQMKVRRNGELVRTIPVTTGKPGFATRSGIKPIMAKEGTIIMDAASGGTPRNSPEYYRLTVPLAMRLTWSGEYVHSAPWSVASQGRRNVSHGCIGMSPTNAAWLYSNSRVGDLTVTTKSGRAAPEAGNGITEWNVPWERWLTASQTGLQSVPATSAKKAAPTLDSADDATTGTVPTHAPSAASKFPTVPRF